MMQYVPHTPEEFADALRALLPPGKAWEWPDSGMGGTILRGTSEELARLEGGIPDVLRLAIEKHHPKYSSWHISVYNRVAEEALAAAGIRETMPRKPFSVGSHVGDRLWSADAPNTDFTVPLVEVYHLFAPMAAGRRAGDGSGRDPAARVWSAAGRTRYILLVRYYVPVVDPRILWRALAGFAQAHVFLWFEDITGVGGHYASH